MASDPILQIALPGPLRVLYDYLPPENPPHNPAVGCRYQIPFGRSSRIGILMAINANSDVPPDRLKRALRQIDTQPLLGSSDLRLLHWAANYYQHPLGDVIFHALPVTLRKHSSRSGSRQNGVRLTTLGNTVNPESLRQAPKQLALMRALAQTPEGMARTILMQRLQISQSVVRVLLEKGWIERCQIPESPQPVTSYSNDIDLNSEQREAVDQVYRQLGRFRPFLLHGVTGSGKTEVYLRLIETVVGRGQQALLLVPEIGLTPQLLQRFQKSMGAGVAVLHSALADGERERVWQTLRRGQRPILIGTRSAVFTPMPNLGLIIVDEEHDLSYKQQEGFRYSARDLALVRGQQCGCPVVLGSATPSLESLRNVAEGRYTRLSLPQRVGNARIPPLMLLDIRNVHLDGGLSPALIKQLRQTLDADEQALLFLNRRGYAPMLTCHACGWLTDCPRCDARMTHHRQLQLLWCHHCGHQRREPNQCPECGCPDLRPLGQGTERVEEALQRHFPGTPLARIDRDSTSRKGALEQILSRIKAGEFPLLLGTQMLAKGHHFPDVTLVAILDVDQGLFGADFRASERMAQLVLQVAGRAGRAERPGRVLIQTRHPDHPLMQLLTKRGYEAFADEALEERRAAAFPPYSHQVLLRAESTKAADPENFLNQAIKVGRALNGNGSLEFWGPVPAPMARKAGKTRAHLLIQSAHRQPLHQWLTKWVSEIARLSEARRVRWSIDVDPQEML
ncbi:MAG: primosomal protein N' [Candidatus Thiodiazotropha sp. (ex. Lucinisca nassula)]|nr:primosomal protein N' [Candidatus Thiodiazotropha sp. (ex. Lucinisca nassula)]MBW9273188.1 primosomal protein N' [Candidatus Thiodiazotropha sp. (ex. Lucinisca nassula)]PUB82765.1 MAG: primosomal protein N' [gamma proteobacterium symbiont of Ctena orbiculata]PUB88468.1 MAG: primosomal protein N' [gamma proteobacterium symbiont of Ctena orbiculata]